MADFELKSDEEKAEELKAWWRTNGTSVLAGVALTVGGMFGWNYWQKHQVTQSEEASRIFSQLTKSGADADASLKKLNDEFSGTAYSSLAALTVAKTSCETGKTDQCIEQLRYASKSSQDAVANIAKIRLARTLISTGKLDEASGLLSEKMPAAFASLITELKGDIFFANEDFAKAREAYDKAILSSGGQNIQGLQLKRDDLGDHLKNGA